MRAAAAGEPAPPAGGGFIPATSSAIKADVWGTPLGYCAWSNGDAPGTLGPAGTAYLLGQDSTVVPTATFNTAPSFAVIAAGDDRQFQTSCAQAAAGAAAAGSDDGVNLVQVSQALQLASLWQPATDGMHYNSKVGIGTSAPEEQLDVTGNARITGSIKASSMDLDTPLPVAEGGTGAGTAAAARSNLSAQMSDPDLTAVAGLSGTCIAVRTAADTWAQRTLTGPANGLAITNPAGIAGNPTISLSNDLAALEGLGGTGLAVRTAADTWAQRSLTAPAAGLTITNPGGVAGNITFALSNDLAALEGLATTGLVERTGDGTMATAPVTAWAKGLPAADAAAGRTTLGLGSLAVENAAGIATSLLPSGVRDLGSAGAPWNTVYAGSFVGNVAGNASGSAGSVAASGITGTVQISQGGTGATTAAAARTALGSDDAANLTAGTLAAARLPTSGVVAGTYGSASVVPVLAVDAMGRITAASNTAIGIAGSQVTSGTVAAARLGSGTADATRWLRGDGSWQALTAASTGSLDGGTTSTQGGYFGDIHLFDDTTPSHYLRITNAQNLTARARSA
jgi:hypothetical protein